MIFSFQLSIDNCVNLFIERWEHFEWEHLQLKYGDHCSPNNIVLMNNSFKFTSELSLPELIHIVES